MAVTDPASTLPISSTPASGHQSPAAADAAVQEPVQAAAAAAPAAQAPPLPQPIGLTLSYDDATHRLVLEAREPGSGFVISSIPSRYVVSQFTATLGGIAPARGATVDSAA